MKPHLLLADGDVNLDVSGLPFTEDLMQDLQLGPLVHAMAPDDEYLRRIGLGVLLNPLTDPSAILRRQQLLAEVLADPGPMRELYDVAIAGTKADKGFIFMPVRPQQPALMLSRDVRLLDITFGILNDVRHVTARAAATYHSRAFTDFTTMIDDQLDDAFMDELKIRIRQLAFPDGTLMTAELGPSTEVADQQLKIVDRGRMTLFHRTPLPRPYYSFTIPERDEAGHGALAELRERSLIAAADDATEAADHIMAFFALLRAESAFYIAATNLHAALMELGIPTVFPSTTPTKGFGVRGLIDPSLGLREHSAPIGNDLKTENRVVVITGANQGGKSTMLRALGTAQLMAQSGLYVAAFEARFGLPRRVFTHSAREEDEKLQRGKLDDELARMNAIIERAESGDLLLCNESFASTNEAEGSQIAYEITRALAACDITMVIVTHQYELARHIAADAELPATFLRAERGDNGVRPHRLIESGPLRSSFAVDIYDQVFGTHFAGTHFAGTEGA